MAADNASVPDDAAKGAKEAVKQPPPPAAYKLARSTTENNVLNTIDIYGEKPFSV